MDTIPYFSWKNRIISSQLLVVVVVFLLPVSQLIAQWQTSSVSIGTSVMQRDANVQDIQNFRAIVIDLKLWQSKVLQNTLIFMVPVTISYLVDLQSSGKALLLNAVTLKAEAFFVPLSVNQKFAPFITSSFGPAYFSASKLGHFEQGGRCGFQSTLGIGTYYTMAYSFRAYILHYCSAGLYSKNRGMTIPVLSGGLNF